MQSRTWVFLVLSLLQMPGSAAEEKVPRLEDLSKSHPNCRLYGHFYAPQRIIFAPAPSPNPLYLRMASYQKETTRYGIGLRIKVSSFSDLISSKTSKSFSGLKEVDEFIHQNSRSFSGIDLDF